MSSSSEHEPNRCRICSAGASLHVTELHAPGRVEQFHYCADHGLRDTQELAVQHLRQIFSHPAEADAVVAHFSDAFGMSRERASQALQNLMDHLPTEGT